MITFKLEKDTRGYHAWSPELPGCHTFSGTRAETLANLKDAVRLYLDDVMEEALLPGQRTGQQPAARRRA